LADPYGYQDPNAQLEQLLQKQLGPVQQQLQQLADWRAQFEQQSHEQQIANALQAEVAALKDQHAAHLPEEVQKNFEDTIERFAMRYAQPGADPKQVIAKAWADFESLSNQIEKAALQRKVDAPAPAEGGGVADVNPEQIRTLKAAGPVALEALQAMNRANRGTQ
jgi:hypothetical protein